MLIQLTDDPPNAESQMGDLDGGLVANDRFYVRCNFPVPELDAAAWELKVAGAFEHRRTWNLDELRTLPQVERTVTLECAGNGRTLVTPAPAGTPWGLGAVGTARFGGVRLADLLAVSGVRPEAVELVFAGADRGMVEPEGAIAYEFNLDVATAVADGPILAWTMGGKPLAPEHGFPVRLVVPGHYGMRSVKWLTRITAVGRPFLGHFPRKYRYRGMADVLEESPVGPIRVRSLITSPTDGERLRVEPIVLRGIAWSGGGRITSVEVGIGRTWLPAELGEPLDGTGPATWTFAWAPPSGGSHALAVRATDAGGHRQPESPIRNEGGYGNNVVHRITIEAG
jgi:DMSO/TMAO reductase YedYZ molybdopterin-dependent catalytic subunit